MVALRWSRTAGVIQVGQSPPPCPSESSELLGHTYLGVYQSATHMELWLYQDGTRDSLLQQRPLADFRPINSQGFAFRAHALGDVVFWEAFDSGSGFHEYIQSWDADDDAVGLVDTGGEQFDTIDHPSPPPDLDAAWYRYQDGSGSDILTLEVPLLQNLVVDLTSPGSNLAGTTTGASGYVSYWDRVAGSYHHLTDGDVVEPDGFGRLPSGPIHVTPYANFNVAGPGDRAGVGGVLVRTTPSPAAVLRVDDDGVVTDVWKSEWGAPPAFVARTNPAGTHWCSRYGTGGTKLVRSTVAAPSEDCTVRPEITLDQLPDGGYPDVLLPRD